MRTRALLVVALLAVVVSIAVLLGIGEAVPVPAEVAPPPPRSILPLPVSVAAERTAAETVPPSSMTCTVHGRVMNGDEEALHGAEVALGASRHRAVCNEDGRFVLTGVSADPSAWIEVTHPGTAGLVRPLTLWPEARVDVGDLVLQTEARIRGIVVDPEGRPVAAAEVTTAAGRSAVTDGNGAFQIAGLRADRHVLRARVVGYAGQPGSPVQLSAGETVEDVELRLDHARTLTGRLLTSAGTPIVGGEIVVRMRSAVTDGRTGNAQSDREGFFAAGPFPEGEVELVVTHPEFLVFGRKYPTDAGDLHITLTSTRTVFGRVVDGRTGEAVELTRVLLLVSSEAETGPWCALGEPVVSAPDDAAAGRFRVPLGIHTTARVVALSAGYAPAVSKPFWMGREDVGPLVLHARPGLRLRVMLRDDRRRPVPGAEISVLTRTGDGGLLQIGAGVPLAQQLSADDGTFESTPLAPGPYRIRVRRVGYMHVDQDIDIAAEEPAALHLVVGRAGTIRGRINYRPDMPRRLRVVAVRLDGSTARGSGRPERRSSARVQGGVFVLDALEAGRYRLHLQGLAGDETYGRSAAVANVAVGTESYVVCEWLKPE